LNFPRFHALCYRLEHDPVSSPVFCLFLGALFSCAFAPLELFWLAPVVLAILFRQLVRAPGERHAALRIWLFGMGLFLSGVSWVYVSLYAFGGMSMLLATVPTFLLCLTLAVAHPVAGGIFRRHLPASPWRQAFFFAAFWTALDLGRGWLFTGFPWLALGFSQTPPSPLAGYAPILGVYGLSFAVALVAALLAIGSRQTPRPWIAALLVLAVGGGLRFIPWTHPVGSPVSVALIQSNIRQDQKWKPENFLATLALYRKLITQHPARLTVLPETALPVFLDTIPQYYLADLKTWAQRQNGDLLIGVPTRTREHYWNSAVSFGASPSQTYSKTHLVPFGEYIPKGFEWFLRLASIPMVGFSSGPADQQPLAIAGQQVATNICYEDLFGQELLPPLPRATLMVNLSNTAWFGRSLAQAQHLQIARMRALETGRPMLRATNTGMTAIIRPDGYVQAVLEPFTTGVLKGEVRGHQGITPYIVWGDACIALLVLGILLWLQWTGRKKPGRHGAA
jgi:apolipoprotein N-acyltransferase